MLIRKKTKPQHTKKKPGTGLIGTRLRFFAPILLCLILLLGGCGRKEIFLESGKDSSDDIVDAQVVSGEDDGSGMSLENGDDLAEDASQDDEAGPPEPALTEPVINRTADAVNQGDSVRRVVCLIIPSDAGIFGEEKDAILPLLTEAGYGLNLQIYHYSADEQKAAFRTAIDNSVTAIICDNLYGQVTREDVEEAKRKGIPTFLIGRGISDSGVARAQIQTNRAGMLDELAEYFAMKDEGGLRCVSLEGCLDDGLSGEEMTLFNRELEKYDNITVLDRKTEKEYDSEDAKTLIRELLDENSSANAVICYSALQAEAACAVLDERNAAGSVRVLCVNGDRDTIGTLVENGRVDAALVARGGDMASMAAENLIRFYQYGTADWSERLYVSAVLMTGDSLSEDGT